MSIFFVNEILLWLLSLISLPLARSRTPSTRDRWTSGACGSSDGADGAPHNPHVEQNRERARHRQHGNRIVPPHEAFSRTGNASSLWNVRAPRSAIFQHE